ncbi:MAG: amidohydrolase [Synergistaceae bacterium]|nr:amidohydrolase [Synergistaceae bacterium]
MTENRSLQSVLEEHFKWFHRHPELSLEERATTDHIGEILRSADVEILDTGLDTGLVAQVRGGPGKDGPTVALRADIDALPILEDSGLPYSSENEGRMHACGHDFHVAALIGASILLKERTPRLAGNVRLIFQPAEEGAGGAALVIGHGALDGVREIYGLHVSADLEPGVVAIRAGADHSAVDSFTVYLRGKGGHAALPHRCADTITALAQFVSTAQSVVSRNVDPFDNAVLSVTHVCSGNTWNVIPDEAFAEGTIRTLNRATRELVLARLSEIAAGVAGAAGVEATVETKNRCPATDNAPELVEFVTRVAEALGMPVVPCVPDMSGEDFALYQERVRGIFFSLGVGSPRPIHNSAFIANPAPLESAANLMATLAEKSLERLSGQN